jgi:hypothetical protein
MYSIFTLNEMLELEINKKIKQIYLSKVMSKLKFRMYLLSAFLLINRFTY